MRKTGFRPGIKLGISDWNASALTTEPRLPDKSQSTIYLYFITRNIYTMCTAHNHVTTLTQRLGTAELATGLRLGTSAILIPLLSYFSCCSLDLLLFFLSGLLLGTHQAFLGAVEGAVEKAVIPRIASRVVDGRHHRANEQRSKGYSTSCLASVRLPHPQ